MSKPYTDKTEDKLKIRTFESNIESDELVWHRDRENRTVTVLEGEGWFFQMDNDVPKEMKPGDILEVKKMEYHRIYKAGTTPLKISIKEKYMKTFKEFNEAKDKSSPIYKEYLQLKKLSIKSLRNELSRNYKVVDLKGYDKEGAISQILRDKYGNKKVDKVFNKAHD